MTVLREAGDAAKGDQRGRRGGAKGLLVYYMHRILFTVIPNITLVVFSIF